MTQSNTETRHGRRYSARHRAPSQPVARTAMRTATAGAAAGACLVALPVATSLGGSASAQSRSAYAAAHNPRGSVNATVSGDILRVWGRAGDPDTAEAIAVRIGVHGRPGHLLAWADKPGHVFDARIRVAAGSRQVVQVEAINKRYGTGNTILGRIASRLVAAPNPYSGAQRVASAMLARYGWGQDQMTPLIRLWSKESGWRTNAANPSGAYGIPQALPGAKMASAGADWQTNPATQIAWGLNYIKGRYGSPAAAWSHSVSYNWY